MSEADKIKNSTNSKQRATRRLKRQQNGEMVKCVVVVGESSNTAIGMRR
jgi:hypothetical protein